MVCSGVCWSFRYIMTFFFFNDTATTEIYTLSLHDALPIYVGQREVEREGRGWRSRREIGSADRRARSRWPGQRSEEHTSELQSRQYLVCRLLLEKKNTPPPTYLPTHISSFLTNSPFRRTSA